MRRTVAITSLLLAWICANGAIWDVAQLMAWTRMFAGYAQEMTVTSALRETLNPEKPCEFCRSIAKAKETERQQTAQSPESSAQKIVLACETITPVAFTAPASQWSGTDVREMKDWTDSVPVPPPRV